MLPRYVNCPQIMWKCCVVLSVLLTVGFGQDDVEVTTDSKLAEGEKKMSDQILVILEHFKQPNPVGIPGADVPDPYPVPDMKQSLSLGTLYFKNTAVYGISNFKILYVNAEIGAMEVNAALAIDKIQARGNYTLSTWLNRAQGPFTVDISGLKIMAKATLGVERDGKLQAQGITIDLGFTNIAVNFENLGFFGSMFQGIVNSVGTFLFDSIKPYVLQMELDPYKVKDYNTTASVFTINLNHTWIMGISSFQRVGNITLKLENNTVIADFEIGTQKLQGLTQWEISAISGLLSRAGTASFSVEYISGRIVLAQPLDTRKQPQFRDLDLEVGNIQVRFDGAGTLDYIIELAVNVLPNLLRYQIMDAIEGPLKERLQQELNKVNVEEMIKQELPKIDDMQEKGFKLSALRVAEAQDEPYDKDDFFNF
ncbi:PREDICTED: uncharacterized protein LOC106111003 [Papilio polytes]|uniref:uncharacterized protein LOC106111003 n=1 Tax=Papilio polytes TaxID=76194 RepID=UPI0006764DB7|nr:PREDICTED: uncharacterized protein LOC106111003 [Papilio polytes]